MKDRTATIFGGTGFLGRRIVRHLRAAGASVRIASRNPDRARAQFGNADPELAAIEADVHDEASVTSAVADAYGVVNAVSLYAERGNQTFYSVHVRAAERVATQARRRGVERFVHVSGIGADAASRSPYIRSRGEGELAVRAAFPGATIIRPAVMFGPDDSFLTVVVKLLRRLPAYPLFGQGNTRLQPAYVEDVAEVVARVLQASKMHPITYELGGPYIYSYKEFLQTIARHAEIRRILVPVPFPIWAALAFAAEMLPRPPVTRNQVDLMRMDNVASPAMPGFDDLGISPHAIEPVLQEILRTDASGQIT
jgi:NADH dehydrogenase